MKDPIAAPPRLRDDPDLRGIGFGAERADTTFDVDALAHRLDARIAAGALPRLDPTALSGVRGLIVGALAGLAVGAAAATVVARGSATVPVVAPVERAAPPPAAPADAAPVAPSPPSPLAAPAAPPTRVAPAAAPQGGLSAELALLDRAEAARRAGRLEVAAAELRAYRTRFPGGQLVVEAELALLAVRVAQGDGRAVQEQGERLLRDARFADRAAEIRAAMDSTRGGP